LKEEKNQVEGKDGAAKRVEPEKGRKMVGRGLGRSRQDSGGAAKLFQNSLKNRMAGG